LQANRDAGYASDVRWIKQAIASIDSGFKKGPLKPRPFEPWDESASIISKPAKAWPTPINSDAYIGIAGEFIRLVAPQTESDPSTLLIAFLTFIGSLMGRTAKEKMGGALQAAGRGWQYTERSATPDMGWRDTANDGPEQ
jgi:hypothetical protein